MSFTMTNDQKDLALDAITADANGGYLKIYTAPVPANCQAALGSPTLLISLPMNATAFGPAVNGTATANAITQANAADTGTAAFYRIYKADGTTPLFQGTVGTVGTDLILNTVSIVALGPSNVSSFTISI